jgi:hypothetical protein
LNDTTFLFTIALLVSKQRTHYGKLLLEMNSNMMEKIELIYQKMYAVPPESLTAQLDMDFELLDLPLSTHAELVKFDAQLANRNYADQIVSEI